MWCNSRCSHENLLSKTEPSHPSVQHNYFSLTSICLQTKKKKNLTCIVSWCQSQKEAEDDGCHGNHVCNSSSSSSRIWPLSTNTCIYTRAGTDHLSSVAPKLRTGSPLLHHGSQSCRDCTLMAFCAACFSTWVFKRLTVDLVHRCVVFLLSPWALIYIYAIWVNNQAAKSSI